MKVDAQIGEERCQILSYLKPTQNIVSGGALTILRTAEHHKKKKKVTEDA